MLFPAVRTGTRSDWTRHAAGSANPLQDLHGKATDRTTTNAHQNLSQEARNSTHTHTPPNQCRDPSCLTQGSIMVKQERDTACHRTCDIYAMFRECHTDRSRGHRLTALR